MKKTLTGANFATDGGARAPLSGFAANGTP